MSDATALRRLLELALAEDIGEGDITGLATIPADATGRAHITAKQELVVAGVAVLPPLWAMVDAGVSLEVLARDGDRLGRGDRVATLCGPTRALLAGERTSLNFLGRLCGIATLTAQFVAAAAGTRAKILDTRKTTPGWRALEKAAVAAGGGVNHRRGLFDQVLIKDNHVDACGSIGVAVARARAAAPGRTIEVEVRDEGELAEAIAAGADIVLLDNMDVETIRRCVAVAAGRAALEVSGGVTLERIPALAATGVDRISVGALTHSAPHADLHMKLVKD